MAPQKSIYPWHYVSLSVVLKRAPTFILVLLTMPLIAQDGPDLTGALVDHRVTALREGGAGASPGQRDAVSHLYRPGSGDWVNCTVFPPWNYPVAIPTKYTQLEIVSTGGPPAGVVSARLSSSWRKEKACFESMSVFSM